MAQLACIAVSFNQPRFCHNVLWNPNATTFANSTTIGELSFGIFITKNNTVYVSNRVDSSIVVWTEGNIVPTRNISMNLSSPYGIFVSTAGDIYVDSRGSTGQIDKWTLNSTTGVRVMYTTAKCYNVFVDVDDNLYCSMYTYHQVVKKSLNSSSNTTTVVAGVGCPGFISNMLYNPWGIFVDINFDLYVADVNNDRIQLFKSGELNGTTVVGIGSLNPTIILNHPTGITLDGNNYIYIVDSWRHRIVGSGPNGFRCLVGCSSLSGLASDQLNTPKSLSFDSHGNMFVADTSNNRTQKFSLLTGLCDQLTTTATTMKSMNTASDTSQLTFSPTSIAQLSDVTTSPLYRSPSYNQPKFNANASWCAKAITFVASNTSGTNSDGIFANTNNTIYVADQARRQIRIWYNNSINPTRTISTNISGSKILYVTSNGDIYVGTGALNGRVDKWISNSNTSVSVMNISESCDGLFIDITDALYCSMSQLHQVVKKLLNNSAETATIVAGTGCFGFSSNLLNEPWGIFVDINFDLYVADAKNDRIQLFSSGQLNGTTIAGNSSSNITIALNFPTGIVLDADKYLFIVDRDNHRIVGSGPNGFRCLVGCSGSSGSASSQLSYPQTLSFDSYGNMFVTNNGDGRIQKFFLSNGSCETQTTISTTETTSAIVHTSDPPFFSTDVTSAVTSTMTKETQTPNNQPKPFFVLSSCNNSTNIGVNCNVSTHPCHILQPCENNGTCFPIMSSDYNCSCPSGFSGIHCEIDDRLCKSHTCLNHGTCNETSNRTFHCTCDDGWQGEHCQSMTNLCDSSPCRNNGVCRPSLLNYTCMCLGDSYSGRYCEISTRKILIYKTISKSFGYIVILAMTCVVAFIVIMDILKYCFGIDPVHEERERYRRQKLRNQRRRRPVVQRFVYVNRPGMSLSEQSRGSIKETRV